MEYDVDFHKMFELGVTENDNPAVRVLNDFDICPITLAALVTALYETVISCFSNSFI
jgi:hypothetical protein